MKIANLFIAGAAALMMASCGGIDMDKVKELGKVSSSDLTQEQKDEINDIATAGYEAATDMLEADMQATTAMALASKLDEKDQSDDLKEAKQAYEKKVEELTKQLLDK